MDNFISNIHKKKDEDIIEILTDIKPSEIDENLIKELFKVFVDRKNPMIREIISDIFKKAESEYLIEKLIELFANEDPILRNTAIVILQSKGEKIINYLEKSLDNPNKDIRKLIIDTASKIESNKVKNIFKKALKDKDINVIIAAVEYIGNLGLKDFNEDILNIFLNSKDQFLKVTALETLSKIGGKKYLKEIKDIFEKEAFDSLLFFPYLKYLANYGDYDDLTVLGNYLEKEGTIYLKEISNAIEHIAEREKIKILPDIIFNKLSEILFSKIRSINKYGLITFLSIFDNKKIEDILSKALMDNDRMLVLGALESILQKGLENKFAKQVKIIKEKFSKDDELQELISDILYFSEES